jgi:hypothetical protein
VEVGRKQRANLSPAQHSPIDRIVRRDVPSLESELDHPLPVLSRVPARLRDEQRVLLEARKQELVLESVFDEALGGLPVLDDRVAQGVVDLLVRAVDLRARPEEESRGLLLGSCVGRDVAVRCRYDAFGSVFSSVSI